jgi:hypothetical protein
MQIRVKFGFQHCKKGAQFQKILSSYCVITRVPFYVAGEKALGDSGPHLAEIHTHLLIQTKRDICDQGMTLLVVSHM